MSKQLQLDLFREQHFLNSLPEHDLYWSRQSGEQITDVPSDWGCIDYGTFFWLTPFAWTQEEWDLDYSFNLISSWGTFPRLHVYSAHHRTDGIKSTAVRLYFTYPAYSNPSPPPCESGDICKLMRLAVETFEQDRRSAYWNSQSRTSSHSYFEKLETRIRAVNFLRKAIRFTEGRPGKVICGQGYA